MKILYDDPFVSVYELDAIHLGENPNGMDIDEECVNNSIDSFANKPLYGVIDNQWNPLDGKHNDFLEHFREEMPERITRDRILPFGCIPESAVKDARLVQRDGKTYLRMNAVVWKRLLPHVSEILMRRDGDVKVSVEFVVEDATQDKDTGILHIHKFNITAVTAIGEKFKEVMEGAKLKSIKFSYSDCIKDSNKKYFSFSSQKSYDIPQNVLKNMKDGVHMREKCGRGGTKQVYNSMKSIVNCGKLYESQLIDFKNYYNSVNSVPSNSNPPTSKYIVFNMYGGNEGIEWLNSLDCSGSAVAINKNSSKGGSRLANKVIDIDNSKEAAVKSDSWENPESKLYGPLMEASNSDSLLHEAYLVVEDGYKDAPSEHLKYPHHRIENGKLVIDVSGLRAAFARASAQQIVKGEVKKHLERHYNELGLSMENFAEKCAELEAKLAKMTEDYESKCAEATASKEAQCAAEAKCAETEAKFESMNAEIKEKTEKLAEFERKEETACNMAMLNEYNGCMDAEKMSELKECACKMSKEEMKNAVAEAVMAFAKSKLCSEEDCGSEFKFSYGFPPANMYFNPSRKEIKDDLSKVVNKYKTVVI